MNWPFVLKSRYADREREILELKQELKDLKYAHARVLDEINFRSTGFHVDERFVGKEAAPVAPQPETKQEELTGIGASIAQVGTRPSAIRRHMELTSQSNLEKAEQEARIGRENDLKAQAAARMETILKKNSAPATA
jgi:hypothetical protein